MIETDYYRDVMSECWRDLLVCYDRVHGYVCTVVCAYGIVSNLLSIIVLTRHWMRTPINCVLTAMAICDLCCMFSYLVYQLHFFVLR